MADTFNILSLFSGSGMLDEAVDCALHARGIDARVLGMCEREACAADLLLVRMENQTLRPAPVFAGCLSRLDARPLRGHIDLLTASPPCQPYSAAGKRRGNDDERSHAGNDAPLPHVIRIIDECRPALAFFENVGEWVTGGHFRRFGEELCRMGYDIAPPVFLAASDVGAPHERERVFILAYTGGYQRESWAARFGVRTGSGELGDARIADGERLTREILGPQAGISCKGKFDGDCPVGLEYANEGMGDTEHARPEAGTADQQGGAGIGRHRHADAGAELAERPSGGLRAVGESSGGDGFADGCRGQLADGGRERHEGDGQAWPAAGATGRSGGADFCRPLFPPGRNDYRRWAVLVAGGLDPTLMPAIESGVSVVADGLGPSASDLLRIGGNGVCTLAAAVAFDVLLDSMGLTNPATRPEGDE